MINPVGSISKFDITETGTAFKAASVLKVDFMRIEKELPKSKKIDWLNIDKILESNTKFLEQKEPFVVHDYGPRTVKTIRNSKIDKEQEHISKPITDRTAYNSKQLKLAGVKEKDIIKYLTYDGHVTFEGKKILKAHGKSYK